LALIRGRFLGLKGDVAILQLEEALIADGNSNDIRGKISAGWLATADWLTVNHPGFFPYVLLAVSEQGGCVSLVSERGAEDD